MNPLLRLHLYLRIALWVLLVFAWAPALAASALALRLSDGVEISVALLVSAFALSSLAGATALVFRLDRELRRAPDEPLLRPWLFCAMHMLGSWLSGTLCLLVTQSVTGVDVWYKLAAIVMASFAGARYVEAKTEAFISRASTSETASNDP